MKPLNRKMFRQPGISRQPMGILASSPELANVVRRRMGQPVQMANGGQNVTNYMSAIRDLAAKGDKATLNNIARDQRLPRSVQMAAANALTGRTVPGQVPTVSDAERMAANRANLGALRGRVGQDALTDQAMAQINAANRPSTPPVTFAERGIQGPPNIDAMGNVNTSTDDAMQAAMQANVDTSGPSLIDRGIASAGNIMDMIRNAIPDAKGYADPPSSTLTPRGVKDRRALAMGLEDDPNLRSELQKNIDASISARLSDDGGPPKTEAEKLAEGPSTFGAARSVSTLDPGAQKEADAALPETTIDPATQDPGVRAGITGTEPPKKVKKKKTAVETALDIALENETADAQAEKTVIGAKTNENINAAIASALETQQSNATDKEKAEATDSILGITADKRKERVKARQALIKEILGEDKAKDMRTDANYNLIMLGLLTATGQSSSALANFAEAAKLTLGSYAKVVGEKSEAKRKEDRAIALKAIDEVGAEISVEEKRAYENLIRADEQQFRKDLQEQKDVAALERLDRQLTSAEQRQVEEFKFKRALNNRTFRQNIAMLDIKAENAEALQQMNNNFKMELQELKNQEDSAAIKTARILQASNPTKYPTLDDAYAATKALSTTRPTDEQQRYNRLVASGMLPSQAIIFAQSGVTTEMFKQMGVEKAQEAIGGLMGGGQTAAPATITIADLPEAQRNQISKYKPGETVPTKQGNYLVTNAGTLVPVR